MQFGSAAQWDQSIKTTKDGSALDAASPLYYSFTTVREREQRIFATQEEAAAGGQTWDLDP